MNNLYFYKYFQGQPLLYFNFLNFDFFTIFLDFLKNISQALRGQGWCFLIFFIQRFLVKDSGLSNTLFKDFLVQDNGFFKSSFKGLQGLKGCRIFTIFSKTPCKGQQLLESIVFKYIFWSIQRSKMQYFFIPSAICLPSASSK